MKTIDDITIKDMITQIGESEEALATKLNWLHLRCLLETEACVRDGVAGYDNADVLMKNFLLNIFPKEECDIIELIKEKNETKELENMFYEFLSDIDNENDINDSWKSEAKVFISKLKNYRSMGVLDSNISVQLMDYAKKINNDNLRYIYELIQNADDCEYSSRENLVEVMIIIREKELEISYPEDGMTYSDIIAITTIGQSNKRKKKRKKIIGEKGRGFKTIFSVCDYAEIHSGPFHFKLSQDSFEPEWIEEDGKEEPGTKMILHFKENENKEKFTAGKDLFDKIKVRYGFNECDKENNILRNCPIIFTNNIEKLTIQYNGEELHMKKSISISDDEGDRKNEGDRKKGEILVTYSVTKLGENTDTWNLNFYWYEKEVKFTYEEYISHYKDVFKDKEEFDNADPTVISYPIVLIAPKKEKEIKDWKGNMFTYLPTFTNINASVSIQAPFELNEDRSCMWINGEKGDDHEFSDFDDGYREQGGRYTTKWNRRLLNELFVDQVTNLSLIKYAYEQMVDELKGSCTEIYDYIPAYQINNHNFFLPQDNKYAECVDKFNLLCKKNDVNVIFENFKSLKFLKRLVGEDRISCSDAPLYFDKSIDCILQDVLQGESPDDKSLNDFLTKDNDKDNNERLYLSVIESIEEKYSNLIALGVKKIADWDKEKIVRFTNYLLSNAFEKTICELHKGDKCSEYLPKPGERKGLKAIRIQNDNQKWQYFSPEDVELWIYLQEGESKYDGKKLKTISMETGVKDEDNCSIGVADIYGKNFLNAAECNWEDIWKYIYSKTGTEVTVNCSFGLYKELIDYFAHEKDWYGYSLKLLSEGNESSGEGDDKIPPENIRTIWKIKYKEYRGDKLDGSNGNA